MGWAYDILNKTERLMQARSGALPIKHIQISGEAVPTVRKVHTKREFPLHMGAACQTNLTMMRF